MNIELLECGHPESPHHEFTRGYGTDSKGNRHCYDCCAKNDKAQLIQDGKGVMYLVESKNDKGQIIHELTNWPGSLRFRVTGMTAGRHNIARTRYNVWFTGPDGKPWYGVQYGDNTQICHIRRIKS